jgi:uncharacterized membrane protein YbaN (DUF454 family)
LLLPLVPGLLFLVVGAIVAAKLSPAFASTLRRNATLAGYLDKTDGFADLAPGKKIQLVCLLCVRMMLDGIALLVATVMRLIKAAERA